MSEMLNAMKNTNGNVQDGLQHTLQQMNSLNPTNVKGFDLKFDSGDLECKNCRFDVEMNSSTPRFYEYKSYKDASQISIDQFKNYIGSIASLSELKYVFNSIKLTPAQAKEGMKTLLKSNAEEIFTIGNPKGFFKDIKLKDGTKITISSWEQLKGLCDNVDFSESSLFDFVTSN
jgi:hypothetical protein